MDEPLMPFCSERCRVLDLANWAAEKYVISTPAIPGSEERSEAPAPPEGNRENE